MHTLCALDFDINQPFLLFFTGNCPSWYLSRIYVEDLQNQKRYLFNCEQWLAVEFDDGKIDRLLPLSDKNDAKAFSHMFRTKTAEDFSDQHIWLSVFFKRPYDTFTRVQRLTCCVCCFSLQCSPVLCFSILEGINNILFELDH